MGPVMIVVMQPIRVRGGSGCITRVRHRVRPLLRESPVLPLYFPVRSRGPLNTRAGNDHQPRDAGTGTRETQAPQHGPLCLTLREHVYGQQSRVRARASSRRLG